MIADDISVLIRHLILQIEHRRAYNCEIMLTKVKIPLPDLMVRWESILRFLYFSSIAKKFNVIGPHDINNMLVIKGRNS